MVKKQTMKSVLDLLKKKENKINQKTKTMKHSETIDLRDKLQKVKNLIGFEINYCIKVNLQRLKIALAPLVDMEMEDEKLIAQFNAELKALREKYATVDGEVKYKTNGSTVQYDVPDAKLKQLELDVKSLKVKHKKSLDAFSKKKKAYNDFLKKTDSKFKITKVKKQFIPKDITTENLDLIFDLIED